MQRYRYTWFLLSLIAMITLAPIAERGAIADIAHQILFTSIVLLALNAATEETRSPGRSRGVRGELADHGLVRFPGRLGPIPIPAGIVFFCLLFVMLYELLTQLLRVRQTDFDLRAPAAPPIFFSASPGQPPSMSSKRSGRARSEG